MKKILLSTYLVVITVVALVFGICYFTKPNGNEIHYLTKSEATALVQKIATDIGITQEEQVTPTSISIKNGEGSVKGYFADATKASLATYLKLAEGFILEDINQNTIYKDKYVVAGTGGAETYIQFNYTNIHNGIEVKMYSEATKEDIIFRFVSNDKEYKEWELTVISNAPIIHQNGNWLGAGYLNCRVKDGKFLEYTQMGVGTVAYNQENTAKAETLTVDGVHSFSFEYYSYETGLTVDTSKMTDEEKLIIAKEAYKHKEAETFGNWSGTDKISEIDIIEKTLKWN